MIRSGSSVATLTLSAASALLISPTMGATNMKWVRFAPDCPHAASEFVPGRLWALPPGFTGSEKSGPTIGKHKPWKGKKGKIYNLGPTAAGLSVGMKTEWGGGVVLETHVGGRLWLTRFDQDPQTKEDNEPRKNNAMNKDTTEILPKVSQDKELLEVEETEHDLNTAISALKEIYTILKQKAQSVSGTKERYAWLVAKDTLLLIDKKLP